MSWSLITFPNVSSYIRGRTGTFSDDRGGGVGKAKDPFLQVEEDEQPKK